MDEKTSKTHLLSLRKELKKLSLKMYLSLRKEIKKKEGNLKFNRKSIKVSDIANQFYCEKKVELGYIHDTLRTEEMKIGKEAHEKLIERSKGVKLKEIWKNIYTKPHYWLAEFPFLVKYKNIFLIGKPDLVYFMNGIPAIIYEFKFSKSQRPYRSYHVQAQIYGILLGEMKFKTTSLSYAIIIIPPEMRNNIKLMKELPKRILQSFILEKLCKKEKSLLTIDNIKIFINKFNPEQAERDLNWALEFWREERIAIPTSKIYKCKKCEHKTKCDENLSF